MSKDLDGFTPEQIELAPILARIAHLLPHAAPETAVSRLLAAGLVDWATVGTILVPRASERASELLAVAAETLLAQLSAGQQVAVPATGPHWDGVFLYWDAQVLRTVSKNADVQRFWLIAFQSRNWAQAISLEELGQTGKQAAGPRSDALGSLNRGQHPQRMCFGSNSDYAWWERVPE